jgi:hypothetical protein
MSAELVPAPPGIVRLLEEAKIAYQDSSLKLTLIAAPVAAPGAGVRVTSCDDNSPDIGTFRDGALMWPIRCAQSMGEINIAKLDNFVIMSFSKTAQGLDSFSEFANVAGAELHAASPSIITVNIPGPPSSLWAAAIIFSKATAGFAKVGDSGVRILEQPWAASITVLKAMLNQTQMTAQRNCFADNQTDTRSDQDESKKRSTERGEGRAKLIAALTKHHQYADGGCLNLEPIGNNELAKAVDVSPSTASTFFNDKFQGHAKYKTLCQDAGKLTVALKLLNDEFAPYHLLGAASSDLAAPEEEDADGE